MGQPQAKFPLRWRVPVRAPKDYDVPHFLLHRDSLRILTVLSDFQPRAWNDMKTQEIIARSLRVLE